MGLYLGANKQKIILDNIIYHLNLTSKIDITHNDALLSSDNYILVDSNGLYLTVKKEDE